MHALYESMKVYVEDILFLLNPLGYLFKCFGLLLLTETVCFISIFRHKHVDPVYLFCPKAGVMSDKEVFSYVILFRKIQTFYSQDISKHLYNIKWSFLKELLVRYTTGTSEIQ